MVESTLVIRKLDAIVHVRRNQCMTIKTWKIWGSNLSPVYIIGKDMDEVLAQARLINPNYNSVQLYSKEEIQ